MQKFTQRALLLASLLLSGGQNMNAAGRPALVHQIFSPDEFDRFLADKAKENTVEIPKEALRYIGARLKGEKITGLSVSLSPEIGRIFSGQKFSFDLAHFSEVGTKRTVNFHTQFDWERLNAPHAYALMICAFVNTDRDFFDMKKDLVLRDGTQCTFPLPNSAISLTEISARCAEKDGRIFMWCISLGNHSSSNFLDNGIITPQL